MVYKGLNGEKTWEGLEKYKKTQRKKGRRENPDEKVVVVVFFLKRNSVDKHLAGLVAVVGSQRAVWRHRPMAGQFFPSLNFPSSVFFFFR
jgi:hypothetical protein